MKRRLRHLSLWIDVASGRWLGAKPHAPGSGLLQAPIEVMWVDQWSIHMNRADFFEGFVCQFRHTLGTGPQFSTCPCLGHASILLVEPRVGGLGSNIFFRKDT